VILPKIIHNFHSVAIARLTHCVRNKWVKTAFITFQKPEIKHFTYFAGGFFATLPLTGATDFLGVLSSSDSVTEDSVLT
jgi:hypothetical protein